MNHTSRSMVLVIVGVLATLSGCQNEERGVLKAEHDLAKARDDGARAVADARKKAGEDLRQAREGAAQELRGAGREALGNIATARQDAEQARRQALAPPPEILDRIAAVVQRPGLGLISGHVRVSGTTAPPVTPLARTSGCDGMPANDQNFVVNADRTLQNVIVRLTGNVQGPEEVPGGALEIEQVDCMFSPRVAAIVAGQTIDVARVSGVLKVPTLPGSGPFARAQLGGTSVAIQVTRSGGLLTFQDPARPWMRAYVMVLNHGHFAVTDDAGAFTLGNLSPGLYSVESWQERLGRKTARATVLPDRAATLDFTYSGTELGTFADARIPR